MGARYVINVDLADVFEQPGRKGFLYSLAWGDYVEVLETTSSYLRINTVKYMERPDGSILPENIEAYICPKKSSGISPAEVIRPLNKNRVLKVNFVDVQQGDGAVVESPDGKIILVDGGDNQLFARYLAARFRGTSKDKPKKIDCILVSHGDADHFAGLTEIYKSENNRNPLKRLFISPERVYHNGLVKRPSKNADRQTIAEKDLLGETRVIDGKVIVTGLKDNLLKVPDAEMNRPFLSWKKALSEWNSRHEIEFRRLVKGDDRAFRFFNQDDLEISVLGPIPTSKDGVEGLKFLGNPPQDTGDHGISSGSGGLSASHTINGHSIVFRLRYGKFSFLFCGDLNEEAGRMLADQHQKGEITLDSEVLKVPHHGSADFSGEFIQKVAPLVSIVSSGDESTIKEHIHPRATLLGALGKYSRIDQPLIFVTELVAFFNMEGWARLTNPRKTSKRGDFFAFSRTAYGIVKTRTDGTRLLVYTDSGKANMKEAYAFAFGENEAVTFVQVTRV
ncbi:MAG: MBL fold metallo-hydrolase [Victivallaceae bacterium]|nr:MBL fold metallo-hydrolase [Victivallaceae bacterium]